MSNRKVTELTAFTKIVPEDIVHAVTGISGVPINNKGGFGIFLKTYNRSATEISSGLSNDDLDFKNDHGYVLRYGENTTPGTTVMDTAIANALLSNKYIVITDDDYLVTSSLTPTNNSTVEFRGSGRILAGANSIIIFDHPTTAFGVRYLKPSINGNGRTGVVSFDLTAHRLEGAIIYQPFLRSMATGIICREGCHDLVIDSPHFQTVDAPIQILSGSSTIQIRHPAIDTFTNIGIDIKSGANDTVGVEVIGGFIQIGAEGIVDQAFRTKVRGVYFEACTTADISLKSSSSYFFWNAD